MRAPTHQRDGHPPLRRRRSPDGRASDDGSGGMGTEFVASDGPRREELRLLPAPRGPSWEFLRLPSFSRLSPLSADAATAIIPPAFISLVQRSRALPGYQLTPSEILAAATLATPRTGRILAVMRQGGRLLALRALVRCIAVLRRAARAIGWSPPARPPPACPRHRALGCSEQHSAADVPRRRSRSRAAPYPALLAWAPRHGLAEWAVNCRGSNMARRAISRRQGTVADDGGAGRQRVARADPRRPKSDHSDG